MEPRGQPGARTRGGTCADHTRVLAVATVVARPAGVAAAAQRVLGAHTAHVVQQDGPRARAEAAAPRGGERGAAAQQATHDAGLPDVPVVVAHRAPHALVADLDPALAAASPARQAQGRFCGRRGWGVGGEGRERVSVSRGTRERQAHSCPPLPLLCHLQWEK